MKVRFLTLAQQELDDAFAWYNGQVEGLGREFLDELDRAVRRSVVFPYPARDRAWPEKMPAGSFPLRIGLWIGRRYNHCRGSRTSTSQTLLLGRTF